MLVLFVTSDVCWRDCVTQWLIIKALQSDSPPVKPKIGIILSKVFCFVLVLVFLLVCFCLPNLGFFYQFCLPWRVLYGLNELLVPGVCVFWAAWRKTQNCLCHRHGRSTAPSHVVFHRGGARKLAVQKEHPRKALRARVLQSLKG